MWFYRCLLRKNVLKTEEKFKVYWKEIKTLMQLLESINTCKVKYLDHIIRNKKCQLLNLVVQGKEEGKRERGHLQISYTYNISSVTVLLYKAIFRTTEYQEKWRKAGYQLSQRCQLWSQIAMDADR